MGHVDRYDVEVRGMIVEFMGYFRHPFRVFKENPSSYGFAGDIYWFFFQCHVSPFLIRYFRNYYRFVDEAGCVMRRALGVEEGGSVRE